MQAEFWLQRWEKQEIGFHQDAINRYLQKYWNEAQADHPDSQVFVPLCGKSRDMLWLHEQGHDIVGIELSERAIEDFFSENRLDYERHDGIGSRVYRSERLNLLCGDFFQLQKTDVQHCHLVYDRASLVALPVDMRARYAAHLQAILPADASILLVIMEYPQEQMQGPPFSVSEAEVERLFSAQFAIRRLDSFDILEENPRFRARGLTALVEKVFILTRNR